MGHDAEGVVTWRIAGWGPAIAASPDRRMVVASSLREKKWGIFEGVAGELVGGPFECGIWLYSLAWLSSSRYSFLLCVIAKPNLLVGRFIAGASLSCLHLFSVDGKLLKSWTKVSPTGQLVESSTLKNYFNKKTNSNNNNNNSNIYSNNSNIKNDNDSEFDEGYTMNVHCVAALRGDLVAVSEPAANSIWIADLQKGSILQTIDFESPLDLSVTREGTTIFLSVDGRHHVGLITIHKHHASHRRLSSTDR